MHEKDRRGGALYCSRSGAQVLKTSFFFSLSSSSPYQDDPPEWLCACRVDKMVCGSDKRTYGTICELNEEAARRGKPDRFNPQLLMEYWGPCKEGKSGTFLSLTIYRIDF